MEKKAASYRNFYYSITLGAGFIVLLPQLLQQSYRLASMPMWWFSPLAFFFFVYLIWRTSYVGLAAHPIRRWSAMGLMALGAFIGMAATVAESPDIGHLSFLLMLTGWALVRQGIVPWTRVIACCSVLWVTWPLPSALTERISGRLHREAITTASGVLDQLAVKHLTTSSTMDLKTSRLELTPILDHAGSSSALLFVTLVILLFTRHPLLLSLMALASAVVFSWLGDVLLILLQVWAVQNSVSNWDTGWPLIATQTLVFLFEIGMVAATLYSLSYLFNAVPVDSAQKADKGWHGIYNRIAVWPLNFIAVQDEGPAYLEDDEIEGTPKKVDPRRARKTPSYTATRAAVDPFLSQPRLFYATMGCLALTGVFALAGWLIPAREVDLQAIASSASQMDNINAAPNELAGLTLEGQAPIAGANETTRAVGWNYTLPGGVATLTLEYPRRGPGVSQAIEGWSQVDISHSYNVEGWEVLETEFVNSIGNRGYSWVAAINRHGKSYTQRGVVARSVNRLKRSVLGRVLGLSVDDVTYHSRFIVQPPSPFAMQRREEVRSAFASANQSMAQALAVQVSRPRE